SPRPCDPRGMVCLIRTDRHGLRSMSPFRRNHAPPPAEVRRGDRIFLGVLVLTGMVETSLRSDLSWDDPTLWACVALMPTVLWRRSKPLLMIVLAMSVAS